MLTHLLVWTLPQSGGTQFNADLNMLLLIMDIPHAPVDVNKQVTLVADIMFVNLVPFLVSVSRNIHLVTIEHTPSHTLQPHLGPFSNTLSVFMQELA